MRENLLQRILKRFSLRGRVWDTRTLFLSIPASRCAELIRSAVSLNEEIHNIGCVDLILSGLLAGALARDKAAFQIILRCLFGDVAYLIELFF